MPVGENLGMFLDEGLNFSCHIKKNVQSNEGNKYFLIGIHSMQG